MEAKTTFQAALDAYVKPGTLILPFAKNHYRVVELVTKSKKGWVKRPWKSHMFTSHTSFKQLVDSFASMWLKLSANYSAEVHLLDGPSGKGYEDLKRTTTAHLHLHPEVMLKAMPSGTSFFSPPQTNGEEICWLMAPPKERRWHSRDRCNGIILSYSERRL